MQADPSVSPLSGDGETMTLFTEPWDEKMLRLAHELKALRAEIEFAKVDDKRWRQWSPRFRALRNEIDAHLRVVSP